MLPRAQLARGREAGAAGGVGVLLVDSAGVLPPAVYASPCVAAALALVVQCELPEGALALTLPLPLTLTLTLTVTLTLTLTLTRWS